MKSVINAVSLMALLRFAASVEAISAPSSNVSSIAVHLLTGTPSAAIAIQAASCDTFTDIPACAKQCFDKAAVKFGCRDASDLTCECEPANKIQVQVFASNCVLDVCSQDIALLPDLMLKFNATCECVNHGGLPGSTTATPSTPTGSPTGTPTGTPISTPDVTPSTPAASPSPSPTGGCSCRAKADAIPVCGKACIVSAAATVGCGPEDYQCQCSNLDDVKAAAFKCLDTTCGTNAIGVINGLGSLCSCVVAQAAGSCGGGPPPVSSNTPPPVSNSTFSPSISPSTPPSISISTPSPPVSTDTPSASTESPPPSVSSSTSTPPVSTSTPPISTSSQSSNSMPSSASSSSPPPSQSSNPPPPPSSLTVSSSTTVSSLAPVLPGSTSPSSSSGTTSNTAPSTSSNTRYQGENNNNNPNSATEPVQTPLAASKPSDSSNTGNTSSTSSTSKTQTSSSPGNSPKPSSTNSTSVPGQTVKPAGSVHASGARFEIGFILGVVVAGWFVAAIL